MNIIEARPVVFDRAAPLRIARSCALATVAWGALAFGGVYPWAYWPLAVTCQICGSCALLARRDVRIRFTTRGLVLSLAAVGIVGLVQVAPMPLSTLARLSPATMEFVSRTDFAYGAGLTRYHAASIVPSATLIAVALYASFAVLLLGMTRLLSIDGPRRLAEGLTVLALFVAMVGIIQKPLYAGRIYGVWEPRSGGSPFGPFVNKNHFAGWMLMALPLALGLLCAGLERSMRGLRPGWRHRILWLSSPEANRLILLAGAAAVMALSLVLTMSRSGISALAVSLMLTGWFVARGVHGRSRKAAGAAYLVLLAITVVGWAGADKIVSRFSEADWSEFNDRRGAWADALAVASTFPLTGTGLNTYDTVAWLYQRHDLERHYGEAHNDYLQIAGEGGLLVAVPAAICIAIFVRDVRRRLKEDPGSTSWWLRRGAVTALVAIALQETVDFSLQMPGNAALFSVVCAIALHQRTEPAASRSVRATAPELSRPILVFSAAGPDR